MNSFIFSKLCVVVVSLFVFSGCMDIRAVDKKNDDEVVAGEDAGVYAVAVGKSGKYVVQVNPALVQGRVRRTKVESSTATMRVQTGFLKHAQNEKLEIDLSGLEAIPQDDTVEPGRSYRYEFEQIGRDPIVRMVNIPLERLVLRGNINSADPDLSEEGRKFFDAREIKELMIEHGTVITTNGADLELNVDELTIEGHATIRSFASGKVAEVGKDGRSGGVIKISSRIAAGDLRVEMRGEHGGRGKMGEDLKDEDHPKGRDGQAGHSVVARFRGAQFAGRSGFSQPALFVCDFPAGNGGNGEAGKTGNRGFDGKNGGDSGSFVFTVREGLLPRVDLIQPEVGLGGAGGLGGKGGPGGLGGAAGVGVPDRNDYSPNFQNCSGQPGFKGREGDPGPEGNAGKPGKITQP